AFLVTADVPEIYMQEFWATASVHHHAIRFKMDNKKNIVNLESLKDMLHIFIKKLTDVNISKLYQPWRSFAAIINKCLTGKSSVYDSLRLSQAQILSNTKSQRRAMRCIIRGSRRDDHMFSTIKLVSRHQNTQQFGALLPIELTNEEIRNSNAYKEYYAVATGAAPPKPKANVQKTRSNLKAITTRSGVTLAGPLVSPPPFKKVDREPETITNHVLTMSTNNVLPMVFQLSLASTSFSTISSSKMPEVTKDTRKFSLPKLTSTQIILELADRSTTRLAGIAEDVFVKVGKFHFPTDFVIVDYVVDPRVPLILGRPFLRTGRALIDVYGEELTLHVNDEAITFNVGQTSKYSYKDAESINQIDVIDVACEEYVQEDPSPNLPSVKTEYLKQVDATKTKPSIEEPPELKLKELPSHLEYVFLEGTNKLPVIISKELKDEEMSSLLKVLKSHKWAIAWKISDIK
nr:DNA-directed DNA polymerase [Tanacetum cinerariifolium]